MAEVSSRYMIIVSDSTPSLPNKWEELVLWFKPSNGAWYKWNGSGWDLTSDPINETELNAAINAHAALPDVHHPANVGVTGSKTIGSYKLTFTDGLLTKFENV